MPEQSDDDVLAIAPTRSVKVAAAGTILATFTLDRRHMGSPYTFAALEVYQALGVALGVDGALLLGDGVVSRPRIGRLVQAVWQRSPDEIREAAARAYATEYGQPLPEVTFEELRANPYYRPH